MYCHTCAVRIADGDTFCRNCGTESVMIRSADSNISSSKSTAHFLLGSGLFLAACLAIVGGLSLFINGNPQLTILILVVIGTIMSGSYMVLLKRKNRDVRHEGSDAKRTPEIVTSSRHQLPDQRYSVIPDSVTDSTTTKLRL